MILREIDEEIKSRFFSKPRDFANGPDLFVQSTGITPGDIHQ